MDDRSFDIYHKRFKGSIQAIARKLARRDQELFKDLFQEGLIALWALDPSKVRDNEDAWVRQVIYNNMVSWLRKERRRNFDSLDSMLEKGAQVMEGDSGEAQIIAPASRRSPRVGDVDGGDTEEV